MLTSSAIFFAISALIFPIMTMVYGLAGIGSAGNSVATAGMIASPLFALLLKPKADRATALILPDFLFLLFAVAAFISTAIHFDTGDWKEIVLFGCSLLFYVGARFMPRPEAARQATFVASLAVVVVATALSVWQVLSVAITGTNKIDILGMNHAATLFAVACGLLVLSFVTSGRSVRSFASICICGLIFVSMTISTMALVRFTTMTIIFMLGFLILTSFARKEFKFLRALAMVVLVVTIAGAATGANLRRSAVFGSAAEALFGAEKAIRGESVFILGAAMPPSCESPPRMDLSVEIREALIRDSFYFMPKAGLFGYGIDSFQRMTCVRGFPPHNVFMQAIIELGWPAGIFLVWLTLWSLTSGIGGRVSDAEIFAMSGILFASILGLAHGSISRALVLFLFLGLLANLRSSQKPAIA